MDLETECRVDESVEKNEGITNGSVSERLGSLIESKVQNNGSCVVENNGKNELNKNGNSDKSELNQTESERVELLHTPTQKGHGLKKWRRIRRDVSRDGGRNIDIGDMEAQEPRDTGSNRSKRAQYAERKQNSEGSVSFTNAVLRTSDGYALLDDSGLGLSPSFAAGTDSENSEDRSSKSSTAASALKTKYDIPVIAGFQCDTTKMSGLNGRNLTHPALYGQRGKRRTETGKKARGERVKIEKENSHSSMESDSRSSKFVFVQGTYSGNNGIRNEGTNEYGENGDEVEGIRKQVKDGYGDDDREGFEGLSHEDVVADSSWADKDERSENHGPLRDKDSLAESIRALQSAQEALEEEVLKFKDIENEVLVDGPVSDLCSEYIDVEQKLQETSGEGSQSDSQVLQSKVVETAINDVLTELEDLFKQQVEAEVECLAISRTVQKLRVAAMDQVTLLNDYKALASEQTHILHKIGDAENKAALLKREAEKLEKSCDNNANVEELLKLQKRVGKYGSCFAVQLVVLLVFFFGGFILQFSQDYAEVVPT